MDKIENQSVKSVLNLSKNGSVGRLDINGPIGWDWFDEGMSYTAFKAQLDALGNVGLIEVFINSDGGLVFDGIAIFNALREHGAVIHTHVIGIAASIASVIVMAGDRIFMPDNTLMYIHKPLVYSEGNADDMRQTADDLDIAEEILVNSYMRHFKGSKEEVQDLMRAESYLTAEVADAKFNNVSIINSKGAAIAAHRAPIELIGGTPDTNDTELSISIVDKMVNAIRNRVQNNNQEEVDMSKTVPSIESAETDTSKLVQDIASAVAAQMEATRAAMSANANREEDPPEDAPVFTGDMGDPTAVKAYLDTLKAKKRRAAVNWTDPKSVQDYYDQIQADAGETSVPQTNGSTPNSVVKNNGQPFTEEARSAAVARMIKNMN